MTVEDHILFIYSLDIIVCKIQTVLWCAVRGGKNAGYLV